MADTQSDAIVAPQQLDRMLNQLKRINTELSNFSGNPVQNIQRLTALCGELLGASCALYNRLDNGLLCSIGAWQLPLDCQTSDTPEGHLCFDIIKNGGNEIQIVRDLQHTAYADTDPNVRRYNLQTYIGKAVRCSGAYLGSLCAVFGHDFVPTDFDREIIGILASALGVEEERRREFETLRNSEQRYRALVDNQEDAICRWVPGMVLTFTNGSYNRLFATGGQSLVGRRWVDLVHESERENLQLFCDDLVANPRIVTRELQIVAADGSAHWFRWIDTPLFDDAGGLVEYQSVGHDLTQVKSAADALSESEVRYHRMVKAVTDYTFTVRVDNGRPVETIHGDACIAITGYTSQEFARNQFLWITMVHPDDRDMVKGHAENILTDTSLPPVLEHRICRKDGAVRWVQNTTVRHHDAEGRLISYDGLVRDITERKTAEEALRRSEHELKLTLDATTDGIWKWNFATNVMYYSPRYFTMLGYDPVDFDATLESWRGLLHPEDLLRATAILDEFLKTKPDLYENEYRMYARGGEYRWIHAGGKIVERDGHGLAVRMIGTHQDITERKRGEAALRNAQRLESLGILAGGIAHDFNNLLGGIFGYVDMARENIGDDKLVVKLLDKALQAFERARELSGRLLTFAKGGVPVKRLASLAELLKDSVSLIMAGANAKRALHFSDDLWFCEVDTGQINEVFNHLILNARQAMPEGGILELRAENETVREREGRQVSAGRYVKVTIKDNGLGIPRENLSRIFDPFFSTKEKGSGLGLAVTYSIITKHGGFVEVISQLGSGTEFRLYLPASEKRVIAPIDENAEMPTGTGKILVLDDEEFMREVAAEALMNAGYSVVTVADGSEALQACISARAQGEPFDLLLLDLTIPGGMGGKQVVAEMRKTDPEIKAIASSGYSDDPVMAYPHQFGFRATISKPYRKTQLGEVVAQVLSGKTME
jgi:PAS domain S-box-containing protein